MKNLKINSAKNRSKRLFKVAALTLLFTVLSNFQAFAETESPSSLEGLLQNTAIKYTIMGVLFAAIIVFTVITSFKGQNKGSKNSHKAFPRQPFKHRHDHHEGRRGTHLSRR